MKKIIFINIILLNIVYLQGQVTAPIKLDEYLNNVGKNNLSLIAERYNVLIAEAEVISQKIFPDPEVTFEVAEDDFNLELGYTLELGGKRRARINFSKSQLEIEKLYLEHFFREIRAEATEAFADALMNKEMLDLKRSSYNYMLQLSQSDSIRYTLGEISENEARQSRLEAITLLNEMYAQEGEYLSSLALFNRMINNVSDTLYTPHGEWSIFERSYNLGYLLDLSSEHRVDLLAAYKNIESANHELKLIRAERRADVDLMVGYEREWRGMRPNYNSMKAGITIPLKFSNLNKAEIKMARYAIEQSEKEYENLESEVKMEVKQAYFEYESHKKQLNQFHTGALEDAQKLLDGMVYSYQRGETNIVEVLIAQRTFNEIHEQYLETLKGYASSVVELEKSVGIFK